MELPKVIRIEPSSQCNLRCLHCPTGVMDMDRGKMDIAVENRVIETIKKYKSIFKVCVLYHGGEPLLSPRFFNLVKSVRESLKDAKLKTVSNGMLLTEKRSKQLAISGLDFIEFSLDAQSEKESDLIRRNCKADFIINQINKLLEIIEELNSNLHVSISSTQFWDPSLKNNPLIELPKPPKWLQSKFKKIDSIKTCWSMKWPDYNPPSLFDEIELNTESSNYCDHTENTITIRSNGDVVPCCYDLTSKLVMGNILQNDLYDIWNGEKYQELRSTISNKKFNSVCAKCNVVSSKKIFLTSPKLSKKPSFNI